MTTLYLASASPRRRDLLTQLGVAFETLAVEVDERWDGREPADGYTKRLALEKARAGQRVAGSAARVLGADTAVVLDGRILGKAATREDAVAMLTALSGRVHEVYSAVALLDRDREDVRLSISRVTFRPLTDAEIAAYADTGEPIGKAGGYAIQGRAGAFVAHLEGSYSGVVGLPLFETDGLLRGPRAGAPPPA
jgi:septum formation protein